MNTTSSNGSQWLYPIGEVVITDRVLGRGAFGEVKVAVWRNIEVACKRLHVIAEDESKVDTAVEASSLNQEIAILSTLRHPNLVLFLGACIDPVVCQPCIILTELMQHSLYDLLETQQVKLQLPDIIDLSIDIASGLDYLHAHKPPVVHRDISSKNILIVGNRAKISDLGQAKIFGHSSRQTGMPGAMAYSAPETLAGKYSEKIDIFSLGVLVVQMCVSEYPRIDRRETHLDTARAQYPPLSSLVHSMLNYQPQERPTSGTVCQILGGVKFNDRYYPVSRRVPPMGDVGIATRKLLDSDFANKTNEIKLALEQANHRLQAEEQRWRDEASRVDRAEGNLTDMHQLLMDTQARLDQAMAENSRLQSELTQVKSDCQVSEEQNRALHADKARSAEQVNDLEVRLHDATFAVDSLTDDRTQLHQQLDTANRMLANAQANVRHALMSGDEINSELKIAREDCQELETRLEQALTRWRHECNNLTEEKSKTQKLRVQNVGLIEANQNLTRESDMMKSRLDQYFDLPQPVDIHNKFRDDAKTIKRCADELKALKDKIVGLDAENKKLSETKLELEDTVDKLTVANEEQAKNITDMSDQMRQLQRNFEKLERSSVELEQRCQIAESEKRALTSANEKLENDIVRFRDFYQSVKLALRLRQHHQQQAGDGAEARERRDEGEYDDEEEALYNESMARDLQTVDLVQIKGIVENADRSATAPVPFSEAKSSSALLSEGPVTKAEKENAALERKLDAKAKLTVQLTLEKNGLLGLIFLIQENISDEKLAWRSARAIRDLIVQSEEGRNDCVQQRVDEVLLVGLRAFPSSTILQGQCIRLLGALSYGSDLVRRRCGEQGALNLIMFAMETHAFDETVQLHSLTAITNLAHNSIDNRSRFVESGGISLVVAAMEQYKASAKVQRQACWALLTLCGNDEFSRRTAVDGGGSAVITAMINHRFDAGVQQFGCWALSNMTLAGDDIRRKLKKMGALEVCRIAVETHADDAEVLRQARNTVGVLGPR